MKDEHQCGEYIPMSPYSEEEEGDKVEQTVGGFLAEHSDVILPVLAGVVMVLLMLVVMAVMKGF